MATEKESIVELLSKSPVSGPPSSISKGDEEKENVENTRIVDSEEDSGSMSSAPLSEEALVYLMLKMGYRNPSDISTPPPSVLYIAGKARMLTLEKSAQILKRAAREHENDINIPKEEYDEVVHYANADVDPDDERSVEQAKILAAVFYFHSPYVEVRSAVEATDDPTVIVETFRSYLVAIIWAIIGSAFNEFFAHRLMAIRIGTYAVQMLLCPTGILWAKYFPTWGFTVRGRKWALNVDKPWSPKEQMFATLLYSVTSAEFYPHYVVMSQQMYYKDPMSFNYQFWFSVSVQFLSLGLAGIMRRYVVFPAKALWPTIMGTLAINKTLTTKEVDKKGISRRKMFVGAFVFMYIYNWFPTAFLGILNTFNWPTWFAPSNVDLANVTGGITGLGFNPVTSFDWNVITSDSMLVPFFTQFNWYGGCVFGGLIILLVYYKNYKDCQYLPIYTQPLYTNRGEEFDALKILNDKFRLDERKYQAYSPPYYTAGTLVSYGAFIAVYPMLIIYTILTETKVLAHAYKDWFKSIFSLRKKEAWTNTFVEEYHVLDKFDDPHCRMMAEYKEVPEWWYMIVLVLSLIVGVITIAKFPSKTPVWGVFLALGFNFIFLLPTTVLQATTGVSLSLTLLMEIVIGYAIPGNPYTLMIVKSFGFNINGLADNFLTNMKMGHYTKIPPRTHFRGQILMIILQVFVNLAVINWQISNITGMCEPGQEFKFTCPDLRTYYNASIVWGAIGPKRIFDGLYPVLKWCWLIGAFTGLLFGLWRRYFPKYSIPYYNPVLFTRGVMGMSPPYGLMYATPLITTSFFSMYYFKKYYRRLWEKYNYVIAGGFGSGLIFSAVTIFFALQWKGYAISWWGNNIPYSGVDKIGYPRKNVTLTDRSFFGPPPGHYPS